MSESEAVQNPTEAVAPIEETPVEETPVEETPVAPAEETAAVEQPEVAETEKKDGPNILKTTAKIDRENLQNNRKFDATARKVTDEPEEIRKQVMKAQSAQSQEENDSC